MAIQFNAKAFSLCCQMVALSLAASVAQAQTVPTGVTLTCAAPTSTGNTVTLTTAENVWGMDIGDGAGVQPAPAYYYGAPWVLGPGGESAWIGGSTGTVATVAYSLEVRASDPNIVLSPATMTYRYSVDNTVSSITWNSDTTPFAPVTPGWYDSSTAVATKVVTLLSGNNLLVFNTTNAGNPYGLNAEITLTYDCQNRGSGTTDGAYSHSVPVDDLFALGALVAALGAAGAAAVRRRRIR